MNTENNNETNVDVSDEKKVNLIVRDLLVNQEIDYWKERFPELHEIIKANHDNADFMLALLALVKKTPQYREFQDIAIGVLKEYSIIRRDGLIESEEASLKYRFAVLMTSPPFKVERSDVTGIVDLLENYTMEEAIAAFPDTYTEAQENVAKHKPKFAKQKPPVVSRVIIE